MPGGGGIGGRGSIKAWLKRDLHKEKSVKVGSNVNKPKIKWTVTLKDKPGRKAITFTLPRKKTAVTFKWKEVP
jgi:hypothetical protein